MNLVKINKCGLHHHLANKYGLEVLTAGLNISQACTVMGPPPCLAKKYAKPCPAASQGRALVYFGCGSKTIENQLYTTSLAGFKSLFSRAVNTPSLFEFNKPILKKQGRILKDFEKNSTDFEGFVMDFELKTIKTGPMFLCGPGTDFTGLNRLGKTKASFLSPYGQFLLSSRLI